MMKSRYQALIIQTEDSYKSILAQKQWIQLLYLEGGGSLQFNFILLHLVFHIAVSLRDSKRNVNTKKVVPNFNPVSPAK